MAAARKKLFYKIGEACKVLDIQPYVLRYWETEFPSLSPGKSRSGQRVYSEKELAVIRRIKELLYDEGYTIAGAKKKLEGELVEDEQLELGEPGEEEQEVVEVEAGEAETAETVETAETAEERLRRMRAGVERALAQARDLLDRLSS
jgi:DNA-binding transcriptional MerR regulator